MVGDLPIIPKPLTSLNSHEPKVNHETLLSTNVTAEAVKSSTSLQQPKSAVSFKVPQSSRSDKAKETLPSYHSWIGELQAHLSALTSTNNQKPLFCGHSTSDSLPKLHLNKFDGDPLHWSDWSSMFKSIVHDANLSLNEPENAPEKIKGSLSSSWMNSPMPSLLLPLWQNELLSELLV